MVELHRFYPSSLGATHTQNETPHVAVTLSCIFAFLVPAVMSLFGVADLDILGYLGSIATYGLLFVYILVSIAAPFYLSRLRKLRRCHIIFSVLAVFFMVIPVVGSVYPVPTFPYSVFPTSFCCIWLLELGYSGRCNVALPRCLKRWGAIWKPFTVSLLINALVSLKVFSAHPEPAVTIAL